MIKLFRRDAHSTALVFVFILPPFQFNFSKELKILLSSTQALTTF